MKSAEEWVNEREWASEAGAIRVIEMVKLIQRDALLEAAEIVRTFAEDHKTIQPSFTGIRNAILERSREILK